MQYFTKYSLSFYSELQALRGVPQNPMWHPEGDVYTHTIMVLEQAQLIAERENLDDETSMILLFSALCHDFGKAETTKEVDGKIISHGHEQASFRITELFLKKFELNELSEQKILQLVANHYAPNEFYKSEIHNGIKVRDRAIIKLIKRLQPATIDELLLLSEADYKGRGKRIDDNRFQPDSANDFPIGVWLKARIKNIKRGIL